MKQLEHSEQVALMQWWHLVCERFGISEQLLFAIPNGGQRNVIVASKLKAEGVRAGVPDLFLAVARHGDHGLFIEMKKPQGGRASERQLAMLAQLAGNGYATAICNGWIEARDIICEYLQ